MTDEIETFDNILNRIAKSVAQKAGEADTPFDQTLDAFKVLVTYQGLRLKHRGKGTGEEDDAGTFKEFSRNLQAEEQTNGAAGLRDSRRVRRGDA